MILDTSAIVAILRKEPEVETLLAKIVQAPVSRISSATYLEAGIVIDSDRNPVLSRRLDDLIKESPIGVSPFTEGQAKLARAAYRDYGQGSGHPAQLNFGDCFAYALAKELGEPLLFKGDDFSKTDVEAA